MPAMPAADDFAHLHDAFAQGEAKMRAQVLDREHAIIPLEQGNVQALGFHGMSDALSGKFGQACNTHPLVTHASLQHP
jgi:hypothetical protein